MKLLFEPNAYGGVFNIGGLVQGPIGKLAERVKLLTNSTSAVQFVAYEQAYPEGGYEDMQARVPCICKIERIDALRRPASDENCLVQGLPSA